VTDQRSQPGWRSVVLVAGAVVGVVLGAAVLTSVLPTAIQELIFHGPVLIVVLIVGTGFLLWRVARPRPIDVEPTGAEPTGDGDQDPGGG
jgi:hypothetical protein